MKTYFTFLERNKLFTFVNVAGLSISLMFVLLIANMVTRQLTVDKDLPDTDRISGTLGRRTLQLGRPPAKPLSGDRGLVRHECRRPIHAD